MRLSEDLVGCASHTGHLEKRGQKNKDLKRRYFLLHGATLSYFESDDGAEKAKPKPKGQLTVVSVGHAKNSDLPEMDQSPPATRRAISCRRRRCEGRVRRWNDSV